MVAELLHGGPVADAVLNDVRTRVQALRARGKTVGLGTLLVGDDPASAGYVRKKHETCAAVGIESHHRHVPASATQAELLAVVDALNADDAIDGYLIQHPLPAGFDFNQAMLRMDPK